MSFCTLLDHAGIVDTLCSRENLLAANEEIIAVGEFGILSNASDRKSAAIHADRQEARKDLLEEHK